MADQDSQSQNQQTGKSTPDITGNRTRQENTQEVSGTNTDQNTEQTANTAQPKFQSKHKDRAVQPPEASGGASESGPGSNDTTTQDSQETAPATSNQGTDQQPSQAEATSGTGQEQPADAGSQSSKLGNTQQSEGSGSNDDGSVLPPESHLNSLEGKGKDKQPKSSKGKKKWLIGTGVVVLLLVLGLGGYGAYAQYVLPEEAPKSYLQRLSNMESGQYQLNVASESDQADLDVTSEGAFLANPENPQDSQFGGSLDVNIGQGAFNISIESDLRFLDGTGYVRLNNAQTLQAFLPDLESGAWYSWDMSSASDTGNTTVPTDVASTGCTQEDRQALRDYFDNEALDAITLDNTQRHTWIGEQRDGHRVQHYSGEIAGSSIKSMMQGAVEATSQECLSSESANTTNLDQYVFEYDLYTGDDWDETVVRVMQNGSEKATVTLTTSDYNQETDVSVPENATPVQNLLPNELDGQGSGFDFSTNGFGGTSRNGLNQSSSFNSDASTLQSARVGRRDTARRQEASQIAAGIEQYAASNQGVYVSTAAQLESDIMQQAYVSDTVAQNWNGAFRNGSGESGACTDLGPEENIGWYQTVPADDSNPRDYTMSICLEDGDDPVAITG